MMPGYWTALVALVSCCAALAQSAGGGLNTPPSAPTNLRVQDVAEPVGIGARPTFGWIVQDADSDAIQSRYQILVATTLANLNADSADVWDSSAVTSRQQNQIAYAGPPLRSNQRYFWKVRTWDQDLAVSAYSAPASFSVGLLANADWSPARWIKRNTTAADDYSYFRKSLTLPNKTVRRATAYLSSAHKYALYINGNLVGKGPSYHHPQFQYYNAYDISAALRPNAVHVFAVFNHWFGGGQGRAASSRGLIFKAIIEYSDGSSTTVVSDSSWRQSQASSWVTGQPQRNGEGVGYVERIDARNLMANWNSPTFSDAKWSTATSIGAHPVAPWINPLAPDLSRIVETEVAPVSVTAKGGGKYLIDLGRVYAGVPRIAFSGGVSGTVVAMRGGYALNAAGEIDPARNQATNMAYAAVLSGRAFVFEPAEYLGMRYFQIDNAPMAVSSANFKFIRRHHTVDPARSTFTSSDATLNAVWDLMKHSLLLGAQEQFLDTPTREKGSFLGDAAIQSHAAMLTMAERVLTRKTLQEFIQSMSHYWSAVGDTGRINAVYPNNDGARDIPDYTQAYLPWAWAYYMETGDRSFLSDHYARFKQVADYVHRHLDPATGLITNLAGGTAAYQYGIVDWPASMRFGYDMTTTARTVINCWAYLDADVMAQIADVLGYSSDRELYRSRAEALKAAINARLRNGSGVYVDGLTASGLPSSGVSQHANMFPLALGIVPPEQFTSVLNHVKERKMSVGMVTVQWLVRALGQADQGPALLDLYTNANNLGWARCLQRGATATWESWTSDVASNESLSHPWGAAGLDGYVRYILGVQPLRPQHELVRIQPLDFDDQLDAASGSVPTDRGDIAVSWTRSSAGFVMQLSLPSNVRALVYVPKAGLAGNRVIVDGHERIGSDAGNYLSLGQIGSGTHTVERRMPQ